MGPPHAPQVLRQTHFVGSVPRTTAPTPGSGPTDRDSRPQRAGPSAPSRRRRDPPIPRRATPTSSRGHPLVPTRPDSPSSGMPSPTPRCRASGMGRWACSPPIRRPRQRSCSTTTSRGTPEPAPWIPASRRPTHACSCGWRRRPAPPARLAWRSASSAVEPPSPPRPPSAARSPSSARARASLASACSSG